MFRTSSLLITLGGAQKYFLFFAVNGDSPGQDLVGQYPGMGKNMPVSSLLYPVNVASPVWLQNKIASRRYLSKDIFFF